MWQRSQRTGYLACLPVEKLCRAVAQECWRGVRSGANRLKTCQCVLFSRQFPSSSSLRSGLFHSPLARKSPNRVSTCSWRIWQTNEVDEVDEPDEVDRCHKMNVLRMEPLMVRHLQIDSCCAVLPMSESIQ